MHTPPNVIHMETGSPWSEILGGSLVTLLVTKWFEYRAQKRGAKVDMAKNSEDIANVLRIMRHTIKESFYEQVMILVGEDSAGILAVGKNLYVSCQYEEVDPESTIKEIREDVQRWRADAEYYEIYSNMLRSGVVELRTAEMQPSKLKTIYDMQGIKSAFIFYLMTTKDHSKVFYCSIATTVKETPTDEDRFIINSSVDKFVEIFNRHKKYY